MTMEIDNHSNQPCGRREYKPSKYKPSKYKPGKYERIEYSRTVQYCPVQHTRHSDA